MKDRANKVKGFNDGTKTNPETPPMKGGTMKSPDVRKPAAMKSPSKPKKQ